MSVYTCLILKLPNRGKILLGAKVTKRIVKDVGTEAWALRCASFCSGKEDFITFDSVTLIQGIDLHF